MGCFFPGELKETMEHDLLALRKYSLSVFEYWLKFTQLSRYSPKDSYGHEEQNESIYCWFWPSIKQRGSGSMLIGDIYISRLMIYLQRGRKGKIYGVIH